MMVVQNNTILLGIIFNLIYSKFHKGKCRGRVPVGLRGTVCRDGGDECRAPSYETMSGSSDDETRKRLDVRFTRGCRVKKVTGVFSRNHEDKDWWNEL